jgi:PKD repeat protein
MAYQNGGSGRKKGVRIMKKLVLVLLLLAVLCIAPASAWLSGFQYERDVSITSTYPVTLTSYQMKFVFWNTTGVSSGQNCYLNGSISQPTTWNDIRVTTTTDAICDIWIQEFNSTAAIVWVEVPYIYTGETRLRIYTEKPLATAVSDGDATFRFWGTFQVIPLNVDKWIGVGNYTHYTDADGNTVVDIKRNATSGISSVTSIDAFNYATGYEQVYRAKMDRWPATTMGQFASTSMYAMFEGSGQFNNSYSAETRIDANNKHTDTNIGATYTGWHIWKIKRDQAGTSILFTIDNVAVANHTTNIPTVAMPMIFRSEVANADIIVDWAFVKKYVSPEPTVSGYGAPTVEGNPNTQFEAQPRFGPLGTTFYFYDLTTGVHDSWLWDVNGDGVTDFTTQNCNYTYPAAGTYNVSLSTSNSNGTDVQFSPNYILVTDIVTPTPTPTPGNTTILTQVVIEPPAGSAYFPVEFYVMLILIAIAFFVLSIMVRTSDDITGILATVFFLALAWLSMAVDFHGVSSIVSNSTIMVQPYSYTPYIPYLVYIWVMMFFVSLLNLYRIWHLKMVEAVQRKQDLEEAEFREEKQRRGF